MQSKSVLSVAGKEKKNRRKLTIFELAFLVAEITGQGYRYANPSAIVSQALLSVVLVCYGAELYKMCKTPNHAANNDDDALLIPV